MAISGKGRRGLGRHDAVLPGAPACPNG